MHNPTFVPSTLETKASAELNSEVEKELNIKDSTKSLAHLIEDYEEKKEDSQNKN